MAVGERSVPAMAVDAQASAGELGGPPNLSDLVARARDAVEDQRKQLSSKLNDALEQLALIPQPERDRQVALVLEFLEREQLHDLVATTGVQCRAAAIEAVLRVGYPWALQLEPEDMEYFRTQRPAFDRSLVAVKIGAGVAGATSLMTWAASLAHGPSLGVWFADRLRDPIDIATLVGLFAAVAGTAPLLTTPEGSKPNRWGRLLMCGASIALSAALLADGLSSGLTYLHSIFLVPAIGASIAGWWPRKK